MDTELAEIVKEMVQIYGEVEAAKFIQRAHEGRPTGPITNENLHLFRRYRNQVSASAADMLAAAYRHVEGK